MVARNPASSCSTLWLIRWNMSGTWRNGGFLFITLFLIFNRAQIILSRLLAGFYRFLLFGSPPLPLLPLPLSPSLCQRRFRGTSATCRNFFDGVILSLQTFFFHEEFHGFLSPPSCPGQDFLVSPSFIRVASFILRGADTKLGQQLECLLEQ